MENKPGQDNENNPAGDQLEGMDCIDTPGIVAGLTAINRFTGGDLVFGFVTPGFLFSLFHAC